MIEGESVSSGAIPPADSESTPVEVGYCLRCGYDMRGLGVQRCPECGTRFDANEARAFTVKWAWDLRQRLRMANVVSAIGCLVALLYLLTGIHVVLAAVAVIGVAFLIYIAIGLFSSVLALFRADTDSQLQALNRNEARRNVGNCSKAGLVVLLVIAAARLGMDGGIVAAGLPVALGLVLLIWQIRTYVTGRERGYLSLIPESITESIRFGVGVSKFFAVASFILLAALLSVR